MQMDLGIDLITVFFSLRVEPEPCGFLEFNASNSGIFICSGNAPIRNKVFENVLRY